MEACKAAVVFFVRPLCLCVKTQQKTTKEPTWGSEAVIRHIYPVSFVLLIPCKSVLALNDETYVRHINTISLSLAFQVVPPMSSSNSSQKMTTTLTRSP